MTSACAHAVEKTWDICGKPSKRNKNGPRISGTRKKSKKYGVKSVAQHDIGPEHIFGVDVVQRVETEFKFRHGCLQRGAVGFVQGQTYQNFFVHKDTLTSCVFFYKNTLPRPAPQEAKWPLS